ncbi:MAG TPA: glycosyltransferase family 4 protein, partial [Verrucomicrobiae bacterium]|nr:glycosyltransferase family 4 protein [Verrucomicrobiae bacterium]
MKILFLNQSFYPDVVSSAQHLADVALALVQRGHQVTVLCARRACDDPATLFKPQECWHGVRVIRVCSTGFGKDSKWGRILDLLGLLALASLRAFTLPRVDLVVALTSPPLIGLAGSCLARLHGARFVHWTLDLNPDEAIAAGWLRVGSLTALLLERAARRTLRSADCVIVLDRFMRERVLAKGVRPEALSIIPPWSHQPIVGFDPVGRRRFRRQHGLEGKFVIMYSGNHSPCHPLETVLLAAEALAGTPGVVFCFVGGGTEFRRIQRSVQSTQDRGGIASNILCLPY